MTALANSTVATRSPAADLVRARVWSEDKLGLVPSEEREGGLRYLPGDSEFCVFLSAGTSDGACTQLAFAVTDADAAAAELRALGVTFEFYDTPGQSSDTGLVEIAGNYPSKGRGERDG